MKRNLFIALSAAFIVFSMSSCTKPDVTDATDDWENMFKEPEPEPGDGPGNETTDPEPEDPMDEIYPDDRFFRMRGVVMGWDDCRYREALDYIQIAKEYGLNTFSIYGADRNSAEWKTFYSEMEKAGIHLEFQEHMMSFLLPRSLFSSHPEYFRMNEQGTRVEDANGCPSSEGALAEVYKNAIEIGKRYKSTNHKYYFWLDDGGGVCHCDKCKQYNDADQALIFENVIIEALKTFDPDATLAHLCYANTTEPPKKVTPHPDIFLEFAPFYRKWTNPLKDTWIQGENGWTHAKYLKSLADHLQVFPAETAQVLEYWMDDSLFSGWNPNNLKEVPWNYEGVFLNDLDTYASYGIRYITCYCAYVGPNYVKKFGFPQFLVDYASGLYNYEPKK